MPNRGNTAGDTWRVPIIRANLLFRVSINNRDGHREAESWPISVHFPGADRARSTNPCERVLRLSRSQGDGGARHSANFAHRAHRHCVTIVSARKPHYSRPCRIFSSAFTRARKKKKGAHGKQSRRTHEARVTRVRSASTFFLFFFLSSFHARNKFE